MKAITLTLFLALLAFGAASASANTLPSEKRKNGALIQKALAPVQVSLQESSAAFYNNETSRPFLYGTVVGANGLILTKASELDEVKDYHIRVGTKKYRVSEQLARNDTWDVALVKIEAEGLRAVNLSHVDEVEHGTWLVSNGATERRFRRPQPGIVSANKREIPGGTPAVLGVGLSMKDDALLVGTVAEGSGAEKAGIKEGDHLKIVDGIEIKDRENFIEHLRGKSLGELIQLKLKRGEESLEVEVEMMARHKLYPPVLSRNDQLSGGAAKQSARRIGFPMVIQHETRLTRRTVGGPLFTLEGEFVGMNIAAVNRVEAFAIPAKELGEVLKELKKE